MLQSVRLKPLLTAQNPRRPMSSAFSLRMDAGLFSRRQQGLGSAAVCHPEMRI